MKGGAARRLRAYFTNAVAATILLCGTGDGLKLYTIGGKRAARQSATWEPCAAEGALVKAAGAVRFGWDEAWTEATLPANSPCSVATFGGVDPAPGVKKACQCITAAPADGSLDELGIVWTPCAKEGKDCTCDSGRVRFGSGNRWVASEEGTAAGRLPCNAASFGGLDPSVGMRKECWCSRPQAQALPKAKVALVLLSRRPPDLAEWLRYHIGYMGVDHVFIQIEDSPELRDDGPVWHSLPQSYWSKISVWRTPAPGPAFADQRPANDYDTLQTRQMKTMSRARAESKALGIDWLLHIDDDELLYAPVRRPAGEILAALLQTVNQVYLPNVEAVYESAGVKNCFAETSKINMNRYKFVSYANGKAAARVNSKDAAGHDVELYPAGPHQWRLASSGVEPDSVHFDQEPFGPPLMVVHFESCPMIRWEDKFWELGNTAPERRDKIPFKFYRESIKRMQRCVKDGATFVNGAMSASPFPECSQQAMSSFWSAWKTKADTDLTPQDFMPIQIPWASIMAGKN